ncbi:hypothetical protein Taro_012439 [Colocasia esculenta]|uniref:C3H1-type domain-containing protein n=1 Tax=Colocasia esculenta TaxID=4460 RepID=A0A843UDK9_COLES|nr:hypothetical protein [Colocasia esculenta]
MEQGYERGSKAEGGPYPDLGTGLEGDAYVRDAGSGGNLWGVGIVVVQGGLLLVRFLIEFFDVGIEPMWQLSLESRNGGDTVFPERPGEPDCNYYMRTGSCGYGERCRYNHPRNRAMIAASARTGGAYPERAGQPVCQYFLKTGSCKFGASCKFHHTRQGGPVVHPSQLNVYGYPLRPGEKECSYYVKTGNCKFGATCKFHHPQPVATSMPAPAPPLYPMMQSPSVHSPHQFSAVAGWQVARSPPQMPGSYVQAPYGPMILSSGMVPVSGWSPFLPPVNTVVPPGAQPAVEAGSLYGLSHQLSPAPTYIGPYQPVSPSAGLAGPSSSHQREHLLPERHGQPECQYYMKTGDCKYGSTCKYHHPPEQSIPKASYFLNPMGLPLRPVCMFTHSFDIKI